jgi:hypothetical protein
VSSVTLPHDGFLTLIVFGYWAEGHTYPWAYSVRTQLWITPPLSAGDWQFLVNDICVQEESNVGSEAPNFSVCKTWLSRADLFAALPGANHLVGPRHQESKSLISLCINAVGM